MQLKSKLPDKRSGFTLVELAVVIVIIGVLAAFGVPRYIRSVERSKAAHAFAYLSRVQAAQERFHREHGTYTGSFADLGIGEGSPKYFMAAGPEAGQHGLKNSWKMTLTRTGASAGYGAYTLTFTEQGLDTLNSTITRLSDITPIGR
jgi:prepilin-type N-terminal cleavage/methylation domain-containing protein